MLTDHWPLAGLRLTTPRLELRLPADEELAELADLAVAGVHPPEEMPFLVPWTDLPPAERARSVLQYHWRCRAAWTPADWSLPLVVLMDGRVVGTQAVNARDFAVVRQTGSGSWLGARYQRQGIGTEMRAAILHLAFEGLGAEEAVSSAFAHNTASLTVSKKLGYEHDGIAHHAVRDRRVTDHRLRVTRARWAAHRTVPVSLTGLEPCLPLFGAVTPTPRAAR
ncbi:GNAT family N-acetyltransferase [Streptomyces specialis]|uniref:GNAT family N-acetyltransferase n=1 Tax=Streptomyces specialis TaxID=498367 RepID=UPI00073E3913|nr:GNAT family protein [Streptomyces specialis]